MALRAGRVGVSPEIVDNNGFIKGMSCNTYTKTEIDQKLSGKANTSDVYTKSQVDTLLNGKADKSDTYTKDATNNIFLDLLPDLFDTPPNVEASGNPLVLTDSAGGTAAGCIVTFTPTQSGSGTPSPSNVRPISGLAEVNILRNNRNSLPFVNQSKTQSGLTVTPKDGGRYDFTGTATNNIAIELPISVSLSGVYKFVADGYTQTSGSKISLYVQNKGGGGLAAISPNTDIDFDVKEVVSLAFYAGNGATCNYLNVGFALVADAVTDKSFEPYNGETYTIDLDGTRYGGTVDFKTGVLTVTHGYVDIGTLTIALYSVAEGNLFRCAISDIKLVTSLFVANNNVCTMFPCVPTSQRTNYTASQNLNNAAFDIIDNDYSDAASFKTAMSGVYVAYELATPTTVQLTPEEVSVLAGNNVLTTNGDNINLSYPVDVASYIRKKLNMPVQSTRALAKSEVTEEIQEEVKEVSDLKSLEEVVEIKTVEPVETTTVKKTTKRSSTK